MKDAAKLEKKKKLFKSSTFLSFIKNHNPWSSRLKQTRR